MGCGVRGTGYGVRGAGLDFARQTHPTIASVVSCIIWLIGTVLVIPKFFYIHKIEYYSIFYLGNTQKSIEAQKMSLS